MDLDTIDIISELSREESEPPVKVLLNQDRQAQLHANNRSYEVHESDSTYLVLETGNGYDRVHHIDADELKVKKKEKFEERENALDYIQDYSNSSS